MEDFSFADFMHLAVYHKRDIFAPSPVGVSPRTWNPETVHPALSRPSQPLPDDSAAASYYTSRRAVRRSPIGAKLAPGDGESSEKARLDAETERLRSIEIPEMEKWAQLLQSGGLSHTCHCSCLYSEPWCFATLAAAFLHCTLAAVAISIPELCVLCIHRCMSMAWFTIVRCISMSTTHATRHVSLCLLAEQLLTTALKSMIIL